MVTIETLQSCGKQTNPIEGAFIDEINALRWLVLAPNETRHCSVAILGQNETRQGVRIFTALNVNYSTVM